MVIKKEQFGWFRKGGFEKDPFLTEADKRYYRRRLGKEYEKPKLEKELKRSKKGDWILALIPEKAWEKEQRDYEKIQKAIEKKDAKSLDRWIRQFGEGKKDWLT